MTTPDPNSSHRPFISGEAVLLVDRKGRRNLLRLEAGSEYHTHTGVLLHDELIGRSEGANIKTSGGAFYMAMRPTLTDFVLKMKRGAQVIYPKDLGQILMMADIFPSARVLEAGVGSGALSIALLRAGAHVFGYELREDFATRAELNVRDFLGNEASERYSVEIRDIYDGIDTLGLDRIVLDLPEPWRAVPHAERALAPGGILLSYLPSITQVSLLHDRLGNSRFEMEHTVEIMQRSWHVEGRAVRPDHRMVGHTGFLTTARLLGH